MAQDTPHPQHQYPQSKPDDKSRLWRHTTHQHRIITEGRNRSAPSIGSPTLVWHLGVWRKRNHAKTQGRNGPDGDTIEDIKEIDKYIDEYEEHIDGFYQEAFAFLTELQERGLSQADSIQSFDLKPIAIEGVDNEDIPKHEKERRHAQKPYRFSVFQSQSASFTLWWRDRAKNGALNTRIRHDDTDADQALRVFVQFQGFQDHFTLTFYIDAAKLLTGEALLKREQVQVELGERRTRLVDCLDTIRRSCHEQIVSGAIDLPSAQAAASAAADKALKAAADYLFDGIWQELQSAFGFRTRLQGEKDPKDDRPFPDAGLVFTNQRGVAMAVRGLDTEDDTKRAEQIRDLARRNGIAVQDEPPSTEPWRQLARSASATLGPVDVFDSKSGEPEVVVKSLWPFLSHMTEDAGQKDWIGCGILDWRALFMSTLGARAQPPRLEDVDQPHLRTLPPERFLIVTKGEPHRRQIGRFVERLLSLETMRAIAFKNLGTIHNASLHLRTLTMALDDILEEWSKERKGIQRPWDEARKAYRARRQRGDVVRTPGGDYIVAEEEFYNKLSALNAQYETQLIDIAASLERIGPGGSGHLAYSIDEAAYYIGEFDRMVPTLEIGNIAGWINYAQFADRGMRPTFNIVKNTGQRLVAAQERLKALTDVVQVSALIVQSDATRRNTSTLRQISHNIQLLYRPLLFLMRIFGSVLFILLFIAINWAQLWKTLQETFPRLGGVVHSLYQWLIALVKF